MNPREDQWGAEPALARRWHVRRHLGCAKGLEDLVHAPQFGIRHTRADAPGIDEVPVVVIVGEQQGAEERPGALGLAVAEDAPTPA
jgi:hypothetical protein